MAVCATSQSFNPVFCSSIRPVGRGLTVGVAIIEGVLRYKKTPHNMCGPQHVFN